MKRITTPILTLLLPAFCAATAAAQFTAIRFAAPVNPISGMSGAIAVPSAGFGGRGLVTPIMAPRATPTPAFALTAAPRAQVDTVFVPIALPPLPRAAALNESKPSGEVAAPAAPDDAKEQKLNRLFDNKGRPVKPVVKLPRSKPTDSDHHVSLPEKDLERELGL